MNGSTFEGNLVEKITNLVSLVDDVFKNHSNPNLLSEGAIKQ